MILLSSAGVLPPLPLQPSSRLPPSDLLWLAAHMSSDSPFEGATSSSESAPFPSAFDMGRGPQEVAAVFLLCSFL